MTVKACLVDLQASGQLDAERAALFAQVYDDIEASYRGKMSAAAAAAAASDQTVKRVAADILQRKRQAALEFKARGDILANVERLTQDGVEMDTVLLGHLDRDEQVTDVRNVSFHSRAIRAQAYAKAAAFAGASERGVATQVRNVGQVLALVRGLFGEATEDAGVAAMARELGGAFEYLRQRFNMAGGSIGKRENWGLPQKHDRELVKAVPFETWRDDVLAGIDLGKMVDDRTGQPFTATSLQKALRDMYDGIVSAGWDTRKAGGAGGKALANQRAEARFLIFRDADAWLAYQRKYGGVAGVSERAVASAVLDLITSHIGDMADDIAAMEILGPNPDATVRWMQDLLQKAEGLGALTDGRVLSAQSKAKAAAKKIGLLWQYQRGNLSVPVIDGLARFGSGVRSLNVASKLGGAFLSAIPDGWAGFMARFYNGMAPLQVVSDYVMWMLPRVKAGDKALAVRAGLITDEMLSHLGALQRMSSEVNASGLMARTAGTIVNVSLLTRWSRVGKQIFGLQMMSELADRAGLAFDALPPRMQRRLQVHGITPERWDVMRRVGVDPESGLMRFDLLADADGLKPGEGQDLADRLMTMVLTETQFAVAETSETLRAQMTFGTQTGTSGGEAVRLGTQFLGFPATFLFQHLGRMLHGKVMNPALYGAALFAGSTILGALAMQIKQLVAGKDPIPMNDSKAWLAAAAQGGGIGIAGDLLFSDYSRTGGGLTSMLMGPTFGQVDQLANLTFGNAQSVLGGENTNVGREAVRFARANTPGSNLWYTRAALDRLIWSNLQELVDPDYQAAVRRMERRAQKEFGQGYWWAPDEELPARAPDFANAIEGERE